MPISSSVVDFDMTLSQDVPATNAERVCAQRPALTRVRTITASHPGWWPMCRKRRWSGDADDASGFASGFMSIRLEMALRQPSQYCANVSIHRFHLLKVLFSAETSVSAASALDVQALSMLAEACHLYGKRKSVS